MQNILGIGIKKGVVKNTLALSFEGIKKHLEFETADLFYFELLGRKYVAICDDEGLLKDNHISIVKKNKEYGDQYIAGNVFICSYNPLNEEGFESMNKIDFTIINSHIFPTLQKNGAYDVLLIESY